MPLQANRNRRYEDAIIKHWQFIYLKNGSDFGIHHQMQTKFSVQPSELAKALKLNLVG